MEIISNQVPQSTVNKYMLMSKTQKNHTKYQELVQQEQFSLVFDDEDVGEDYQPSFGLKLFFAYLYFTQGLVLAFSATIPYIYPQLPSYDIMAVFSASTLPYSFKFIIAPITEKYSYFKYGKRKFWIVISQVLASFSIFAASLFTSFDKSLQMASFILLANFFMTFQDISLDSLAKKQLRKPHIVSIVGATCQVTGIILGSMILLKFTSLQFARHFSLQKPITNPQLLLTIISVVIFTPSIFIHFFFKQTILKRQYEATVLPICQVFKAYRAFFKLKSKYFRTILFFLFFNQGFNFFYAGYDYELVKAGFSRDLNNTIGNIVAIPVTIISCFMASKIQPFGVKRGLMVAMVAQGLVLCYLRIFFPLNMYVIAIATFVTSLFDQWKFLIMSILIYQFPLHSFTGMFITFLASFTNLGNSQAIHTKILAHVSWWTMSWVGIAVQIVILTFIYFFYYEWKDKGIIDFNQIVTNKQIQAQ